MNAQRALTSTLAAICLTATSACGTTEPGSEGATLVGFWFACEFGASDGCAILDDDGHQFTADGQVYDIEEATQGSEPACGTSPCFSASTPSVTVDRVLEGTYTYDGASLSVTMGSCTETVSFPIGGATTVYTGTCLDDFDDAIGGVVAKFAGSVTIN